MVEEEANPRTERRRRGEVRYTEKSEMQGPYSKMPSGQHSDEKCSPSPHRPSSSDVGACHVSINGSESSGFFAIEQTEIQERQPRRSNLNAQSANDGRSRARKQKPASRNSSRGVLCQEKAAGPRNMKTFQFGAKKKESPRKNGVIGLSAFCDLSAILGGLAFFACLVGGTEAADDIITTRQNLPRDCIDLLKEHLNDCPYRADPLWDKFNTFCCGNYPGIFHCQFKNEGGRKYSMPACLQNQTVPIGKLGLLIKNDSGYPELDLGSYCPSGTYRGHSIDSTYARFEYCDRKTKGGPEEEKRCDGGPYRDDTFICKDGFFAENCPHGHNSHDYCLCQPMQFCNGSQSYVNVTGTCDSGINVTYGCNLTVATSGMSTSTPYFQLSSLASGAINRTTRSWITKPYSSSSKLIEGLIGPVLGAAVAVAVMVSLVVFYRWKRTRNSDLPEHEKMTDSGSSSMDDSICLDVSTESE